MTIAVSRLLKSVTVPFGSTRSLKTSEFVVVSDIHLLSLLASLLAVPTCEGVM